MKPPSFKSLVVDYGRTQMREEIAGMWAVVLLFRLPGFLVAKLAIFLGLSANCLTVSGLGVTLLIALACVFLPAAAAIPVIAALAVCFQVLDCADGTVARATGTASLAGRFFDFATDILWRATCLAAIGHVADGLAPGAAPSWLAIGLGAGFCATYARLMRVYVKGLPVPAGPAPGPARPRQPRQLLLAAPYAFLSGLDEIFALIALAAWAYGGLGVVMGAAVIYHGVDAVIAACEGLAALRAADRRNGAR